MGITSIKYLIFVMVSLLVYWKVPSKYQWIILLIDSLLFYFVNTAAPHTFIYLPTSVMTVYIATRYFKKTTNLKSKKSILILTLIINFGILALLKYTNLAINTINYFAHEEMFSLTTWLAPIAISYYTLQIVSYLLDVYWEVADIEKNPLKLLLFTSYFPLMVSGPISRHQQLHHQFFEEHRFDYDLAARGFRRIAWGFAKKLVVADRLAPIVSYLFDNPDQYTGIWVLVAGFSFLMVLYFDFSGCMDIIIGASNCFGIKLQENFEAPLLSKNIQEVWQRWHISLGAWFKNYIMYPILKTNAMVSLAQKCKKRFGKLGKKFPSFIAMFVVWTLIGLWHGNSWKYIVGEGWWFWILIVISELLQPAFKKILCLLHINPESIIWKAFQVFRTWVLFSIGMLFFNAANLMSALHMIKNLVIPCGIFGPLKTLYITTRSSFGGMVSIFCIVLIGFCQIICEFKMYHKKDIQECIINKPLAIRWVMYFALIFVTLIAGNFGSSSFIYFGF